MHTKRQGVNSSQPGSNQDGFFTHHGFWALGVRLFRRLRFAAKAAIVSALFLIPTLIGFGLYLEQVQHDINQSNKELAGVQLIEKKCLKYCKP